MMCRKVGPMNPMNKILKDILLHLRFVCPEQCKQTYPFQELISHKKKNLCIAGYKRPEEIYKPKEKKKRASTIA